MVFVVRNTVFIDRGVIPMEEMRHLLMLAGEIGPRGATRANEKLASQYIKDEMEKAGLEVETQEFRSVSSFSWTFGAIYLLSILSFFLYLFSPFLAFLVGLTASIIFAKEVNTREIISRVMPGGGSQNVIGKVKAAKYPVLKVIFTAHYDTSRWALSFHPDMVKDFRLSFLLGYFSLLSIPLLFGTANLLYLFKVDLFRELWYPAIPGLLVLLVSLFILLHREVFGRHTPGANDNASGVSVLLALGQEIARQPPGFIETWLVATGCEEAGTVGMIRFLEGQDLDKEKTFFINIDNVGDGQLKYILQEGALKKYPASDRLLKMARLAVQEKPELDASGANYHLLTTDATAAMARGYRAMTLLALDNNGLIPHWHWPTDTHDRVKPQNLVTARELAKRILYRLNDSI